LPTPQDPLVKQQQSKEEDKGDFVNAAWEVNAFHTMRTYQVNATGLKGFSPMEVLFDNQADISIVRPELLWSLQPVNKHECINSVGGTQLEL
jgi:hypothetical protein